MTRRAVKQFSRNLQSLQLTSPGNFIVNDFKYNLGAFIVNFLHFFNLEISSHKLQIVFLIWIEENVSRKSSKQEKCYLIFFQNLGGIMLEAGQRNVNAEVLKKDRT